jgi:hypothetical protein
MKRASLPLLRRREFLTLLGGAAAASAIAALPPNLSAQGLAKSVRIGYRRKH